METSRLRVIRPAFRNFIPSSSLNLINYWGTNELLEKKGNFGRNSGLQAPRGSKPSPGSACEGEGDFRGGPHGRSRHQARSPGSKAREARSPLRPLTQNVCARPPGRAGLDQAPSAPSGGRQSFRLSGSTVRPRPQPETVASERANVRASVSWTRPHAPHAPHGRETRQERTRSPRRAAPRTAARKPERGPASR